MYPRASRLLVAGLGAALLVGPAALAQEALVIDHTCTDLSKIPPYWVEQGKLNFFLTYGHTSHGSQIVSGIQTLNSTLGCSCSSCADGGCTSCDFGFCDDWSYYTYGGSNPQAPAGVLSFCDRKPPGASDLGNPNRTAWEAATRAMLDDPRYVSRNLVIWSWCGQADCSAADMQTYLDLMSGLIADYPNVTFVYMTGHLNGTGVAGNLNQRNNQIRSHVLATGGVLFDFADIESYDPDGNAFLHLNANDGCYYWVEGVQHNWATEWCAAHPDSDLCATCSCAHSQPLNCNLKGRAFWWMLARLAGWPGMAPAQCAGDCDCDNDRDFDDIKYFVAGLSGEQAWIEHHLSRRGTAPTCPYANCDADGAGGVTFDDIKPFVALLGVPCE